MSLPKAYDPQPGYKYQFLYRYGAVKEWDHLDYAIDKSDKDYLYNEYALAYRGTPSEIKVILLPKKYWLKTPANGFKRKPTPVDMEKICKLIYETAGKDAVINYCNHFGLEYQRCEPCDALMPVIPHVNTSPCCAVCGTAFKTS